MEQSIPVNFSLQSVKFPLRDFVVFLHAALVYLVISEFIVCNVPACTHGGFSFKHHWPSQSHPSQKSLELISSSRCQRNNKAFSLNGCLFSSAWSFLRYPVHCVNKQWCSDRSTQEDCSSQRPRRVLWWHFFLKASIFEKGTECLHDNSVVKNENVSR